MLCVNLSKQERVLELPLITGLKLLGAMTTLPHTIQDQYARTLTSLA